MISEQLTALKVKNAKLGRHVDGKGLCLVVKPSGDTWDATICGWTGSYARPSLAMLSSPATMLDAPNKMKHPRSAVPARLRSTLPVSAIKPMLATAIMATVVAMVPSKVPSSHCDDSAGAARIG